jgi:hypothetical protein
MRYIKKFNEQELSIHDWCVKYDVHTFRVNDDDTVDVLGGVNINKSFLEKIPVQFGWVNGSFNCSGNKLKSLDGCPKEVGESFFCSSNKLTTLIGGPLEVGGWYYCASNKLTSLEGCPMKVNKKINCEYNPIFSVYELFPTHESYLESFDYNYLRGDKIIVGRLKIALKAIDIYTELPDFSNEYIVI